MISDSKSQRLSSCIFARVVGPLSMIILGGFSQLNGLQCCVFLAGWLCVFFVGGEDTSSNKTKPQIMKHSKYCLVNRISRTQNQLMLVMALLLSLYISGLLSNQAELVTAHKHYNNWDVHVIDAWLALQKSSPTCYVWRTSLWLL